MASRALEITIISGEGLMLSRTQRVTKNAFVTVGADDTHVSTSTRMDVDGGSYPTWNDKMFLDIPIQCSFLILEAHCKNKYSGDRVLGGVKIPVTDFIGGFTPTDYLHFLSYRLKNDKGEKNGIVNLSIRVNSTKGTNEVVDDAINISKFNYSQPWWLASPYKQFASTTTTTTTTTTATTSVMATKNKVSNADDTVVTGVPVWLRH